MSFLEVKCRSNKGRVTKKRIENKVTDGRLFVEFVSKHIDISPGETR